MRNARSTSSAAALLAAPLLALGLHACAGPGVAADDVGAEHPDDPYHADLVAADLKFGLHEPTAASDERKVGRQRLYFRVEDVAAHRVRVLAHGVDAGELRDTAWMTMFVVVDPDGNEVVFAETDPERHPVDPW